MDSCDSDINRQVIVSSTTIRKQLLKLLKIRCNESVSLVKTLRLGLH